MSLLGQRLDKGLVHDGIVDAEGISSSENPELIHPILDPHQRLPTDTLICARCHPSELF
jgi:uncharacterized protein YijF (DUF1287 family)